MDPQGGAPENPDVLFLCAFHEALDSCGITEEQRQRAIAKTEAKHGRGTAAFNMHAIQSLARALAQEVDDPDIGLRLGASVRRGATGVVEYALMTAPTLRATHALYARIGGLLGEYVEFELREDNGHTLIELCPPPSVKLDRVVEDYRLVRMLSSTRRALGAYSFHPSAVHFTYARPRQISLHEEVFGARTPLEFRRARPGFRVISEALDRPLLGSDPVLHKILVHAAEQLLKAAGSPNSVAARTRQALLAQLHEGRPTASEIARHLGLSERTLRRRLAEENTSFSALLDDVRAELSRVLENSPERNAKRVAAQLGFESPRALRRARSRWEHGAADAAEGERDALPS